MQVTAPGVYDMPADVYHADPVPGGSLSSSGARKLLPPSCPARFRYEHDHRPTPTDEMTFGSAVHKLILGAGADITIVDADNYRAKAAQEAKAGALAEGKIPLLTAEHAKAQTVADAVRSDRLAAKLLTEGAGLPEQVLVWRDPETGIWCRAMLDWIRGRIVVDVKSCVSAAPAKISKAVYEYGYHIQAAHYLDGMRVLGLAEKPAMIFIFVEKARPYLVNVVQLDPLALEAGAHYIRQARLIYRECVDRGEWPGYASDIELIELPGYAQNLYYQETGK
jgi:hypothetical protein